MKSVYWDMDLLRTFSLYVCVSISENPQYCFIFNSTHATALYKFGFSNFHSNFAFKSKFYLITKIIATTSTTVCSSMNEMAMTAIIEYCLWVYTYVELTQNSKLKSNHQQLNTIGSISNPFIKKEALILMCLLCEASRCSVYFQQFIFYILLCVNSMVWYTRRVCWITPFMHFGSHSGQ